MPDGEEPDYKSDNNKQGILEQIRDHARYRPIVPFLGAGISISAGFPTLRFVIQYLAKVDFAIQFGIFENRFPTLKKTQTALERYRLNPSGYLEDFGWPNIGQLNADIWDWLKREAKEAVIAKESVSDLLPNDLYDLSSNQGKPLLFRDRQLAIVQWVLRKELASHERGTKQAMLNEWLQWKKHYFRKVKKKQVPELLYGDWEMLLDKLCEGNHNLADALFTSLEQKLSPTLSHRYLVLLQPKLGMPLIFTTNFDTLLERAFHQEDIPLKVFDVHRDAALPDPHLVCRQTSLLKLHGSAYGLRLGERLRYSLEMDARSNALGYIPPDALMLVMGFNGSERRMMQMLDAFVRRKGNGDSGKLKLIWIQGPGDPGPLANQMISDNIEIVKMLRIIHLDTFTQELYFYINANSYQASAHSYPIISGMPMVDGLKCSVEKKQVLHRPVHLFIANVAKKAKSSSWSFLAGMRFVNSLDQGHTVIWIDLENHHTVEGIISDFFSRVRLIDPYAPSCAITDMDQHSETTISKAVNRIFDVFKRGRYVLVLDMVESFGRPHMVHHGMGTSDTNREKDIKKRIESLSTFLKQLLKYDVPENCSDCFWDSYVVVTAGKPRLRHDGLGSEAHQELLDLILKLKDEGKENKKTHIHRHVQKNNEGYSGLFDSQSSVPMPDPSVGLSEHWRETDKDKNSGSIERAKNVLALLNVLRSNEDIEKKVSGLVNKNVTAAFVCLLSVFRRARSLPLLRSMIERWGLREIRKGRGDLVQGDLVQGDLVQADAAKSTHKAVSELLQLIATEDSPVGVVSQNHEGGNVWLFREVSKASYEALTQNIHAQDWVKDTPKADVIDAIMDGSVHITWHLFAARAYYVDVLLPTQDIRAFWEYLYHRVSAIRIITLLILILKKSEAVHPNVLDKLNQHCKGLNLGGKQDKQFALYAQRLGIFDPIKEDPEDDEKLELMQRLQLLRRNCLNTLLMAVRKNKLLFRVVAAPDSVLAWSREFLQSELKNMEEVPKQEFKTQGSKDDDIGNTLGRLRHEFQMLEYQALFSKLDYKTIFDTCMDNYKCEKEIPKKTTNSDVCDAIQKNFKSDIEALLSSHKEADKEADLQRAQKSLSKLHTIARCYVESRDRDAQQFTKEMHELLLSVIQEPFKPKEESKQQEASGNESAMNGALTTQIKKWANRELLKAQELYCISMFENAIPWTLLLDRTATEECPTQNLRSAEQQSVLYENLLRESTETTDEDSRHRSKALTIRARALYLQGHFSRAHHCLDLASAGLSTDHINYWLPISLVHILRAELLAMSAHEHHLSNDELVKVGFPAALIPDTRVHYFTKKTIYSKACTNECQELQTKDDLSAFAKELLLTASASLKKIERAEQELVHAEKLLRGIAHQNIWLIHMEFGYAQVRIEQMLFEMEVMFLSQKSLDDTEYLKKSGRLEQNILDAMQRLRNVLDIVPYQSLDWQAAKIAKLGETLFQLECSVYKLWLQLFVVGAYYSAMLNCLYETSSSQHATGVKSVLAFVKEIRSAANNVTANKYVEQWGLWCTAMWFDRFLEEISLDDIKDNAALNQSGHFSFRAMVISAMHKVCVDEKIIKMWDIRNK